MILFGSVFSSKALRSSTYLLFGALIISASVAIAQEPLTNAKGEITGVTFAPNDITTRKVRVPDRIAAKKALQSVSDVLGSASSPDNIEFEKTEHDRRRNAHVKFVAQMHGIPVYGNMTIVHLDPNQKPRSITAEPTIPAPSSLDPNISPEQAVEEAKVWWRKNLVGEPFVMEGASLVIFNPSSIDSSLDKTSHLAYVLWLAQESPSEESRKIFVDALNGETFFNISQISEGIRRAIYDGSLGSWQLNTVYQGYTYGRSEGQPYRGANPRVASPTSKYDVDVAYLYASAVYDWWHNMFGLNGSNGVGGIGPLDANQNITIIGANADNTVNTHIAERMKCPNATYNNVMLRFCSGWVVPDVFAHEYMHSVTHFTADLNYAAASGALNESLSDIFGEAFERSWWSSTIPNTPPDWHEGHFVVYRKTDGTTGYGPFRNFEDPTLFHHPDHLYSPYMGCLNGQAPDPILNDQGYVHYNSNVLTHAAYLMQTGGTFNGCTIQAVDHEKVERVFFQALKYHLSRFSGYNDAYNALNASCIELGYGAGVCDEIKKALQSVKLDQGGACSDIVEAEATCVVPAPAPESAASITLDAERISKTRRAYGYVISGYIKGNLGGGINDATVQVSCKRKGKTSTGTSYSDSNGYFGVLYQAKKRSAVTCAAYSNGLSVRTSFKVPRR